MKNKKADEDIRFKEGDPVIAKGRVIGWTRGKGGIILINVAFQHNNENVFIRDDLVKIDYERILSDHERIIEILKEEEAFVMELISPELREKLEAIKNVNKNN